MEWNDIIPYLDKDKIYYTWTGKYKSTQDVFVLVTLTRILAVRWTDRGWQLHLLHGYASKKPDSGRGEIHFGGEPLYRIVSGKRQGFTRPLDLIYENEDCIPADRRLEETPRPEGADPAGEYHSYGALLEKFFEEGAREEDHLVVPEFYLARNPSKSTQNLFLSPDRETMRTMESHPEYDETQPLANNIQNLMSTFGIQAGGRRVAFPWKHFSGQGVAVADPEIFGTWHSVDRENACCDAVGVKVDLTSSKSFEREK